MPRSLPSNATSVARAEALKEVKRRDAALREHLGAEPTIEGVIAVFPTFFPSSHMTGRDILRYAKSVVGKRPHFI